MLMQLWRRCSIYGVLLSCLLFSGVSQALELRLDEGVFIGQKKIPVQVLENSDVQAVVEPAAQAKGEEEALFSWWLLLFVIPLIVWFGWLIAHQKSQYSTRKKQLDTKVTSLESVEKAALAHERKRKKQPHKPQNKVKPRPQFSIIDLNTAYEHHHAGRQKEMLDIIGNAFKHDPFDLNVYIVSMTILSEIDAPPQELIRLVKNGLFLLRTKRHVAWYEVAEKGRLLLPDLEDWSWQHQ